MTIRGSERQIIAERIRIVMDGLRLLDEGKNYNLNMGDGVAYNCSMLDKEYEVCFGCFLHNYFQKLAFDDDERLDFDEGFDQFFGYLGIEQEDRESVMAKVWPYEYKSYDSDSAAYGKHVEGELTLAQAIKTWEKVADNFENWKGEL